MISLLLPSRKRPKEFSRMAKSVTATATHPVEIVARFDDDDKESADAAYKEGALVIIGPRIREITKCWNECFDACSGDIACQANDDLVMITPGWDQMVEKAFDEVPDKILLVHGNDVFGHGNRFGPHPFVHRKWVEALGYFIPPYFCSDFGDAWPNELADRIGRRRYVPFDIEHHHYSYGLCEADENTLERLARHKEDDPDSIYYSSEKTQERIQDAEKLAKLMSSEPDTTGWVPHAKSGVLSMGKCKNCESIMTVPAADGKIHCNRCGKLYERVKK